MTYHFKDHPYQEWMTNLPETLTALPLNYISIPGSHDSFTYSITSDSAVSPDSESLVKKLEQVLGKAARWVISRWSKVQTLNTFGQLDAGIRYFDIRLAKNVGEKDEIYSCHGLFAYPIKTDLLQIKDFLDLHPKEVVLLDINHIYKFEMDEHHRLMRYLEMTFGNRLTPYTPEIPSLDALWKTRNRVFVFYHSNAINKPFLWPGYFIPSPWANTNKVSMMIRFLTNNYNEGHNPNYFHVTQGVMTPTEYDILKHLFSSIKSIISDKATAAFLKWLEDKSTGKGKINCSIIDFIEDVNYVSSIMQMNMKLAGNVCDLLEAHSKKN